MDPELLERVLQSPRLPSLPTIALDVIDLVQQEHVNITQIAETIKLDPGLSSKILKTVNSSFYGQSKSVGTISSALVILGLNSVKTLALGFSLVSNLKNSDDAQFDQVTYWRRCLYSAVAARSLSAQVNLAQQEEAFLGALLQDLGMMAMAQTLGSDYHDVLAKVGSEHRRLASLEAQELGADHAEVGAALAEKWNLPPQLVTPIRFHEDPDSAPPEFERLIRCVAVGGDVADVFISESPGEALESYYSRVHEWFELDKEAAEPLLANIHSGTVEMRRLFDLPTGDLGNADEILARANEAMVTVSLQAAQQTDELEQQNQILHRKATTDPLTGAANRGRFNEYMTEQFDAAGPDAPLSVLFMDTDHFKSFNDTYGHQLGDRVLIELAKALQATAAEPCLVARYGGEEFAVVLPNTVRVSAAKTAEQMRTVVENTPVKAREGDLDITVSIGVATYDGEVFTCADELVAAADKAVYAAKESGRNCVRVFAPKPASKVA